MMKSGSGKKNVLQDLAIITGGLLATGLFLWIVYALLAQAFFLPAIMVLCMMGPPY
jgi:hypothetical protein